MIVSRKPYYLVKRLSLEEVRVALSWKELIKNLGVKLSSVEHEQGARERSSTNDGKGSRRRLNLRSQNGGGA